ncbi:MAG: hypothetical protein JWR75_2103 [Devosia sp.]|nr:hypothetical protein [Devosia sp.]
MRKIYNAWHKLIAALTLPAAPTDPIECLSPRERADLPVYHPRRDDCAA